MQKFILASASKVRADMLKEKGVVFDIIPSSFDEESYKEKIRTLLPSEQALILAKEKARVVSIKKPHAYVIGADQICSIKNMILDKPGNYARAFAHLKTLQGEQHHQHSAACVYLSGSLLWSSIESVELQMRPLSDKCISAYIMKDKPLSACGAYCFEKNGHHLFKTVIGTDEAIKGLPMKSFLNFIKKTSKETNSPSNRRY